VSKGSLDHLVDLFGVSYVDLDSERIEPRVAQFRRSLFDIPRAPAADDDARAERTEPAGNGETDASASAGDDRDLSLEWCACHHAAFRLPAALLRVHVGGANMTAMRLCSPRTAVVIVAAVIASTSCGSRTPEPPPPVSAPAQPAQSQAAPPQATPAPPPAPFDVSGVPRGYVGELPPLPTPQFAVARPPEIVKAVFTFAARHPEVLHYVPCFCGCESRGHRGNDDCFIAGRDVNGRPQWEEHGMG
jgi:hypothetical protein